MTKEKEFEKLLGRLMTFSLNVMDGILHVYVQQGKECLTKIQTMITRVERLQLRIHYHLYNAFTII